MLKSYIYIGVCILKDIRPMSSADASQPYLSSCLVANGMSPLKGRKVHHWDQRKKSLRLNIISHNRPFLHTRIYGDTIHAQHIQNFIMYMQWMYFLYYIFHSFWMNGHRHFYAIKYGEIYNKYSEFWCQKLEM